MAQPLPWNAMSPMRSPSSLHVHRQPVAAQRVVAVGAASASGSAPEVPRVLVVVEDDLAVEVVEVHQPNTSRARAQARRPAGRSRRACCRRRTRRAPWPARRSAPSPAGAVVAGADRDALAGRGSCRRRADARRRARRRPRRPSRGAVPMIAQAGDRGQPLGGVDAAARARAAAMRSMPSRFDVVDRRRRGRSRRRCSACRPRTCTAARCRSVFSNVTDRIMSPPPCHGGIASSSASRP